LTAVADDFECEPLVDFAVGSRKDRQREVRMRVHINKSRRYHHARRINCLRCLRCRKAINHLNPVADDPNIARITQASTAINNHSTFNQNVQHQSQFSLYLRLTQVTGSKASRKPSATKLNANTISAIMSPGTVAVHQAS